MLEGTGSRREPQAEKEGRASLNNESIDPPADDGFWLLWRQMQCLPRVWRRCLFPRNTRSRPAVEKKKMHCDTRCDLSTRLFQYFLLQKPMRADVRMLQVHEVVPSIIPTLIHLLLCWRMSPRWIYVCVFFFYPALPETNMFTTSASCVQLPWQLG